MKLTTRNNSRKGTHFRLLWFEPWFKLRYLLSDPNVSFIDGTLMCTFFLHISRRYSKSKEEEELPRPASLWPVLITRCIDGRIKDCLPNLKRIDCIQLDTLMDLNGCPSCLEVLDCSDCPLIQSLDPLAACTNLRDLTIGLTSVSSLKPLIGCVMLQRMCIESTSVIDLGPLSSCTDLEVLYAYDTQGAASWPRVLGSRHSVGGLGSPKT